ncbi:unnamed protein product, partial [Polarella glacialis]
EGPSGQANREASWQVQEARFSKVLADKEERLADDASTRRAVREERAFAAASKRVLSEARAKFGKNPPRYEARDEDSDTSSGQPVLHYLADDPVVRRARALCSASAQVVAQLEEQNQWLRSKAGAMARAPSASRAPPKPAPLPAEDEALIARARELLLDYKPAEQQRRPPVPRSASVGRAPLSSNASNNNSPKGGLSALQRAGQQCADVSVEISQMGRRR